MIRNVSILEQYLRDEKFERIIPSEPFPNSFFKKTICDISIEVHENAASISVSLYNSDDTYSEIKEYMTYNDTVEFLKNAIKSVIRKDRIRKLMNG